MERTTCHPQTLGGVVHTSGLKHGVLYSNPWVDPVNPEGSRQTQPPFDSRTVGSYPLVSASLFCQYVLI